MLEILIGCLFAGFAIIVFIFTVGHIQEIIGILTRPFVALLEEWGKGALIVIGIVVGVVLLIVLIAKLSDFAGESGKKDKRYDEYNESINNILSKFN